MLLILLLAGYNITDAWVSMNVMLRHSFDSELVSALCEWFPTAPIILLLFKPYVCFFLLQCIWINTCLLFFLFLCPPCLLLLDSQDQFENLDKHTQWGIDFLERYAKFVKERLDIEQNYAKQLRYINTHTKQQRLHMCIPYLRQYRSIVNISICQDNPAND